MTRGSAPFGVVTQTASMPSRRPIVALTAMVMVAFVTIAGAPPSRAASQASATGAALAPSASCKFGDVDITYAANGATRRTVAFTAADGKVLKQLDGKSVDPHYEGTEHVLADATPPPAPGTVVAMYVTLGTTPPTADTSAAFFVLYRCDAKGNEEGGTNTQMKVCFGDVGTCPTTAAEALAAPTGSPVPAGAAPTPGAPTTAAAPTAGAGAAASPGAGAPSGSGGQAGAGAGAGPAASAGGRPASNGVVGPSADPPVTASTTPSVTAPSGGAPIEAASASSSRGPILIAVIALVVLIALGMGLVLRRHRRVEDDEADMVREDSIDRETVDAR